MKKKTKKTKSKTKTSSRFVLKPDHIYIAPTTHRKLPATAGLVLDVRNELKADIAALGHKMDARFNEVDARFNEVDARFNKVDGKFKSIDARFDKMEAHIQEVKSSVHRMEALMEEQRSENRIVLEGLLMSNQQLGLLRNRIERIES